MKIQKNTNIDISKIAKKVSKINAQAGFLASAKYENGTPVALVAMANEYGVPQNNVPPRPFMRPAKLNNSNKWAKTFSKSFVREIESNGNFIEPFNLVGMQAQSDIQEAIAAVTSPPIAESTMKARQSRRTNKSASKEASKPLVDTGYMLASVSYEVKNK